MRQIILGIVAVFFLSFMVIWPYNLVKFIGCDFEPDYKCEAVHGIGIFVPFTAYGTVWFTYDK